MLLSSSTLILKGELVCEYLLKYFIKMLLNISNYSASTLVGQMLES